jgi:hypothetical protein
MWRPYDTEVGKARYGKNGDGGYVILDSALGAKAIFGYGVDRDVSFENKLSSRWNIPAFVFDHTITDIPEIGPGVKFVPEGIAPVDQAPCFTLEKHLRQFEFENSEIILKMDIENCEWDVLRTADLSRVTQLVIEMHDMDTAPKEVLYKLFKNFWLVHIHGNNSHCQATYWVDRVRRMPRYIECTWVRKDLVSQVVPSTSPYPTVLDVKNRADVPELDLTHLWTPVKYPISFVAATPAHEEILKELVCREDEIVTHVNHAKNDWVMVFKPGDVISVRLVNELHTLIRPGCSHIEIAVSYRGVVKCEIRLWNRRDNANVLTSPSNMVQLYSTLGAR